MNKAWAENVDVNQWLSYDEQMVKTVSKFAKYLGRFNKDKPISNGEYQSPSAGGLAAVTFYRKILGTGAGEQGGWVKEIGEGPHPLSV